MPVRIGNNLYELPSNIEKVYIGGTKYYDAGSSTPPVTGTYLQLSSDNEIAMANPVNDYSGQSDNKWAVRMKVRNFVAVAGEWNTVIGTNYAYDGCLFLNRDGNVMYRGYWDTTEHTFVNLVPADFEGSSWVDLMIICDGVDTTVSIDGKSDVITGLAEGVPWSVFGAGYPDEGAAIDIEYIAGWDLGSHAGSFDRATIQGLTPSHEYLIDEGSGLTVGDNIGTNDGTIAIDEVDMWQGVPFSWPTNGLVARYDGGNIVESGGDVEQMTDLSGNDYHLVQTDPARRPVTGTINGQPSVHFTGNGNYCFLDAPSFDASIPDPLTALPQPMTIIAVWSKDDATYGTLMDTQSGDRILVRDNGSELGLYAGNIINTPNTSPFQSVHLIEVNGTSSVIEDVDGSVILSGDAGNLSLNNLRLGQIQSLTTTSTLNGDIAEFAVYDRLLTAQEKTDIQSYLKTKYSM